MSGSVGNMKDEGGLDSTGAVGGVCNLNQAVREALTEKKLFEQRLQVEGMGHLEIWGRVTMGDCR